MLFHETNPKIIYKWEKDWPGIGFGDIWGATNYLLYLSETQNEPIWFSTHETRRKTITEISSHLVSEGKINLTALPGNREINVLRDPCLAYKKFFPTHKTWNHIDSNVIAYQFDGVHKGEYKNLPKRTVESFVKALQDRGYETINVGGHKPIDEIVDVLSACKLFVGCASGISVLSLSVRNPVCIFHRRNDVNWFRYLKNCHYNTSTMNQYFSSPNKFIKYLDHYIE